MWVRYQTNMVYCDSVLTLLLGSTVDQVWLSSWGLLWIRSDSPPGVYCGPGLTLLLGSTVDQVWLSSWGLLWTRSDSPVTFWSGPFFWEFSHFIRLRFSTGLFQIVQKDPWSPQFVCWRWRLSGLWPIRRFLFLRCVGVSAGADRLSLERRFR